MAFLARARKEIPHFRPSVIVVTAKDLGRAELQRLSEDTIAVLQKNGELERELSQVLQSLWGGEPADPPSVLVEAGALGASAIAG
jgi:hypothetical protein